MRSPLTATTGNLGCMATKAQHSQKQNKQINKKIFKHTLRRDFKLELYAIIATSDKILSINIFHLVTFLISAPEEIY